MISSAILYFALFYLFIICLTRYTVGTFWKCLRKSRGSKKKTAWTVEALDGRKREASVVKTAVWPLPILLWRQALYASRHTSLRRQYTDQLLIGHSANEQKTPFSKRSWKKCPCTASYETFQAYLHVMTDLYTSDTLKYVFNLWKQLVYAFKMYAFFIIKCSLCNLYVWRRAARRRCPVQWQFSTFRHKTPNAI